MAYKFNGGCGAIICDYCGVMLCLDISSEAFELVKRYFETEDVCEECFYGLEEYT